MALIFGLTFAICSRCASTMALELSCLERIALASSPADFEVMSPPASDAASAEPISGCGLPLRPRLRGRLHSRNPVVPFYRSCAIRSPQKVPAVPQLILFSVRMQVC